MYQLATHDRVGLRCRHGSCQHVVPVLVSGGKLKVPRQDPVGHSQARRGVATGPLSAGWDLVIRGKVDPGALTAMLGEGTRAAHAVVRPRDLVGGGMLN